MIDIQITKDKIATAKEAIAIEQENVNDINQAISKAQQEMASVTDASQADRCFDKCEKVINEQQRELRKSELKLNTYTEALKNLEAQLAADIEANRLELRSGYLKELRSLADDYNAKAEAMQLAADKINSQLNEARRATNSYFTSYDRIISAKPMLVVYSDNDAGKYSFNTQNMQDKGKAYRPNSLTPTTYTTRTEFENRGAK